MAEEGAKMNIMAHLEELRKRIVVSFVVVLVFFLVAFIYSEDIFRLLVKPMNVDLVFRLKSPFMFFVPREGGITKLIFLAPAEAFWAHSKIALITGVVCATPVIFHQIWGFVAPGLHAKEKKLVLPFVIATTGLFLAGASFCFFIILPFAMRFLLTYKTESLTPMISVEHYVDFCLKFILAFGAVFELPVIILFLTRMGIVSTDTLAKNRKYAILVAFIIAAFLTPTPDAFNQTLMAVPMVVLYEGGILLSRIFKKRKEQKA